MPPRPASSHQAPSRARSTGRWSLILGALLLVAIVGVGATGWTLYDSACTAPCADVSRLTTFAPSEASVVYDRAGHEIGRFYAENRSVTALAELPLVVAQAVVAVEDQRFFQHRGVDWWGFIVATKDIARGRPRGASTITMQLARNVFPATLDFRDRSVARKLREMRVAQEIERALPKERILEAYLNQIYYGVGAHGIEAAARTYFDKSARALTLPEAALLAALPKAPTTYNPFRHPDRARRRRNLILGLMRNQGRITADEAGTAIASPLGVVRTAPPPSFGVEAQVAPYFVEEVRKLLAAELGDSLYRKGYRIYTTLDTAAQGAAERLLEARLSAVEEGEDGTFTGVPRTVGSAIATDAKSTRVPYLQGAVLVLEAETGDVVAMVGGRSYEESRFNRATQAERQPGSAFKPFVYATAIAQGYNPVDRISDDPVTFPTAGGTLWSPQNYDPAEQGGVITLAQALTQSRNRAAVRLAQQVGLDSVIAMAHAFGLSTPLTPYPSLPLGVIDVRMIDLVRAYTPIARNDGNTVRPRLITRVLTKDGRVVLEHTVQARPAAHPEVTYILREMLRKAVDEGTGGPIRRAGYTGPAAGKTGTTNDFADAWFVGATPQWVAGIWVGFDQPRTILRGVAGTGGRLAGPIWGGLMHALDSIRPREARHRWTVPDSLDVEALWTEPASPVLIAPPSAIDDTTQLCLWPDRPDPDVQRDADQAPASNLVPCRLLPPVAQPRRGEAPADSSLRR